MNDRPAVLGNMPMFEHNVPIVRACLPDYTTLSAEAQQIVTSGMVTKGRFVNMFEEAIAAHLGVKHAIAVSSCTTGLMLTYQGLGLTGDVVVPSFTFMATVSSMIWAGLRPVFADVDPDTTNLNPRAAEAAITAATSAIVAIHNFGNPADIVPLQQIAAEHHLRLIFDAAHGFGARYQGVPVGPQGDAHVYSLSPTKLLIAGEGGIVATNNDDLAAAVRMGREYGNNGHYDSAFAGINARMPELNALLGLHSLGLLEEAACRRNEIVELYQAELNQVPGVGFQLVRDRNRSSYKDLSITIDPAAFGLTRDEVVMALAAEHVDTRTYYDPPVHRQIAYQSYADGHVLRHTDWLAQHSLSLPIWSRMDDDLVRRICHALQRIHRYAPDVAEVLAMPRMKEVGG